MRREARDIFDAGLAAADPQLLLSRGLREVPSEGFRFGDDAFVFPYPGAGGRIRVVGAGKAAGSLARALESALSEREYSGRIRRQTRARGPPRAPFGRRGRPSPSGRSGASRDGPPSRRACGESRRGSDFLSSYRRCFGAPRRPRRRHHARGQDPDDGSPPPERRRHPRVERRSEAPFESEGRPPRRESGAGRDSGARGVGRHRRRSLLDRLRAGGGRSDDVRELSRDRGPLRARREDPRTGPRAARGRRARDAERDAQARRPGARASAPRDPRLESAFSRGGEGPRFRSRLRGGDFPVRHGGRRSDGCSGVLGEVERARALEEGPPRFSPAES